MSRHNKANNDQGTSWMYESQQNIDTEAYLTGKKIDKAFEQFLDAQLKDEKSNRSTGITNTGEREADLYNKKLEDPLFAIKANEKSAKERLKANPKKMRMMRKIFEDMLAEKLAMKKAAKKAEKEKERARRKRQKKRDEKREKEAERKKRKIEGLSQPSDQRNLNGNNSSESDSTSATDSEEIENEKIKLDKIRKETLVNRKEDFSNNSWNSERYRSTYINRLVNKDEGIRKFRGGLGMGPNEEIPEIVGPNSRINSKRSDDLANPACAINDPSDEKRKKEKLEKQKRLQAMMDDAKDYELKRKDRAKKSAKLDAAEDEQDRKNSFKGAQFMKDVKLNFNSNQSLEERIKSRKHRQVRTENDLAKNSFKRD